jgi:hypothetical protein
MFANARSLEAGVEAMRSERNVRLITILLSAVAAIGILLCAAPALGSLRSAGADPDSDWADGDVFVGVGSGDYKVYSRDGGYIEQVYNGQAGGVNAGCAFDSSADFYTTSMNPYDRVVKLAGPHPHGILQTIDTTLHDGYSPESIAFAANGDFYVGIAQGNHDIQRYNAAGVWQENYAVETENAGSDWLELSSDQHTMFYTSEGRQIKRYDLATHQQLTPFATLPTGGGPAFAFRLLPPGDGTGGALVADSGVLERLDGDGTVIPPQYIVPGTHIWYGLSLDPTNNAASFWAGDTVSTDLYRFNVEAHVQNTTSYIMGGVCTKGEIAQTTVTPTPTITPTSTSTPTPTVAPTVTCSSTSLWCTDLSPSSTGDNELNGAVALAEDTVWAVGGYNVTPSPRSGQYLIEKWNGTVWATVTVSPVPTVGILNGIAATSQNDIWAVGDNGILHYDGTAWSQVNAPNGANGVAVHTATDAWAVSNSNILHYDGAWSVSTPLPANSALYGVAVIAPQISSQIDVWAVGTSGSASALIMHKVNTGAWSVESNPTPVGSTSAVLNSIDYYHPDVIWAVGSYQKGGIQQTLIEYYNYNGNGWQIVPSPNPGASFNELQHVWVDKQGDAWAVGRYLDYYGNYKTLLLHWSGLQWDQIDTPNPGVESQLVGVTSSSGGSPVIPAVWAVGSYLPSLEDNYQTLVEHLTAPAAPTHPAYSYYERRIDNNMHYQQGHDAAVNHQTGIIVLDYGKPKNFGSATSPDYGTLLIGGRGVKARISDIETEVEWFADGYDAAHQSGDTITIAVSINNDNQDGQASLTTGHAHEWALMISRITTYVLNHHYYEIFLNAGIDVEPDFDIGYSSTATWIQGYLGSSFVVPNLFNFGSMENYPCQSNPPPFPNPDPPCDIWSTENIYQAAWGLGTQPLPEIYRTIDARWWNIIKRWGYDQHSHNVMYFAGDFCCSSLNASQAWRTLWIDLNSDPLPKQTPQWSVLDVVNSPLP